MPHPNKTLIAAAPIWVVWIAQDRDGVWWGYAHEPNRSDSGWYENEVGDCARLDATTPNLNWADSLLHRSELD